VASEYASRERSGTTDLGVHDIRSNICVCDVLSELTAEFCLDLLEVQWLHGCTRTPIDPWLVSDDIGTERLREPSHGLPEISLEELDNRRREIKLVCTVKDVLFGERV
jgi:hypothetical protein